MQRIARLFVLVLIAIGMLIPSQQASMAPTTAPTNTNSPFGINSHIASRYPEIATMHGPADQLQQLGVGWVREDFQMGRIMPSRDQFDWSFHDAAVDALTQRGINIVGILGGPTPTWANASGGFYPPSPQDFAAFCSAVVSRYQGRVSHWEIWNEPADVGGAHWSPAPNPAAYTLLLKAAYASIKAADPNARVLIGGDVSPEPSASFLRQVAQNGGWNSFDIISIHPYTDDQSQNSTGSPETGRIGISGFNQIKSLAQELGNKPIWVTEYGWSTGGPGSRGIYSPQQQADFLVRGGVMLRAYGAERVISYAYSDENDKQYGIVGANFGAPKPAFQAFKTLNHQLSGTTPAGMLDLGQRRTVVDLTQSGTWGADKGYGTLSNGVLNYSFPAPTGGSPHFVVFTSPSSPVIAEAPSQIGMVVNGDNSNHSVNMWVRDAMGRVQFRLGPAGGRGNQLIIPVDKQGEDLDNPGTMRSIQYPLRLHAIVLEENATSARQGTIELLSVVEVGGPQSYGARFNRGGTAVDVLWAPSPAEVTIDTTVGQGTVVDASGASRTINASGGQFTVGVGPSPIYLNHGAAPPPMQHAPVAPAPAQPTTAPAQPTTAPAQPTTAPVQPTTAPAQPPVQQSPAQPPANGTGETPPPTGDGSFAIPAFEQTWRNSKEPERVWGPAPITGGAQEAYAEGNGGTRLVQYFDKGRMELNDPSSGHVSSGLIVLEMIQGSIQVGNNEYMSYQPSVQAVAGDPAEVNPQCPTYRTFQSVAFPLNTERATNLSGQEALIKGLLKDGSTTDEGMRMHIGDYDDTLGHNVPTVFVDYLERYGAWRDVAGLPLSEPYVITTSVGGNELSVMVQVFQRRLLTYNPQNPPNVQVEMGNAGLHYVRWRYGTP